jgi:hypothetical protein
MEIAERLLSEISVSAVLVDSLRILSQFSMCPFRFMPLFPFCIQCLSKKTILTYNLTQNA